TGQRPSYDRRVDELQRSGPAIAQRLKQLGTTFSAELKKLFGDESNPLTMQQIHDGIKACAERTGKAPTCKTDCYVEELPISGHAVDMRLRFLKTSLSAEVKNVLGVRPNLSLAEIRDGLLEHYRATGDWPNSRTGWIASLGLKSQTLMSFDHQIR